MNLRSRMRKLERASGINDPLCSCNGFSHDVEYIDEGEAEPKPQTCAKCQKERRLILIVGVESTIPAPKGGFDRRSIAQ